MQVVQCLYGDGSGDFKGRKSSIDESASSLADADTQRQARRGLTVYLAVVVVLTALSDVLVVALRTLPLLGDFFL